MGITIRGKYNLNVNEKLNVKFRKIVVKKKEITKTLEESMIMDNR